MKKKDWIHAPLTFIPHMTLCLSDEEFMNVQKWIGISPKNRSHYLGERSCAAMVHTFDKVDGDDKPICVVCLAPTADKSFAQIIGLLVHEATHIWQKAREWIDEKDPSPEFEAYSMQAICQTLITAYLEKSSWTVSQ